MRKTTIFRSSCCLAGAVAILPIATASASAQADPAATQEAQIHVVQEGETLWALAEFYFGDPLLWPEIYRLNTVVVEDPHWIFPGEELLLAPREMVALEPGQEPEVVGAEPPDVEVERAPRELEPTEAPPPPPPPAQDVPTVFAGNRPPAMMARPAEQQERRATVNHKRFYSAGFLTEWEEIPWARVVGAADQSVLANLTATSSVVMYEQVGLEAPEGAVYGLGDTLLVAQVTRELPDWGGVVVPTGLLRVTAVSGRDISAVVVDQFDRITGGQLAVPIEPFRAASGRFRDIENGMVGSIIEVRDRHPVPNFSDIVFVDLGRSDGVAVGDVFEVMVPRDDFPDSPGRQVGRVLVLHVRENSSSAAIVGITDLGIASGAPVRLIRKMTS